MGWLLSKYLRRERLDFNKNTTTASTSDKAYSWRKRGNMNPDDYMLVDGNGTTTVKTSNTINGQQFLVQNCKDCYVFVLDWTGAVTIDDCSRCSIVIGACSGSVFVRDCNHCRILAACQQFRSRDSSNLTVHLLCKTKPIVESSFQIGFACLQLFYKDFEGTVPVRGHNLTAVNLTSHSLWQPMETFFTRDFISIFRSLAISSA